ncbi:ADP-forming succinate--CoA ligase subunit beta [Blattabacterium cuenoti]|uniref:Succinate--CoA ligase [ADP-forming] subunit beta n=1 Tax=Blattabacterium cuenoti STAT TaxID=1457030 RepID=A0A224AIM0_9FLAO|nr:ADP-forming succinate--CoA ligase subunit beta [Blattabacterium cuenoti]BBA16991.1 succinyl-CoA ligase (ADP-forming) subunit beta [Blattabacterium cuenoti STAT]
MNLHEYQGREILNSFSIKVPYGEIASSPEEAVKIAKIIFKKTKKNSLVIKAQIHAGGRGKAGGIQIAKNLEEVYEKSKNILGKFLITPQTSKKGKLVRKVLLSEDIYFSELSSPIEYYLSILLNRDIEKNIILYSKEGGVNVENISKKNSMYTEIIDPILGLQLFQTKKIGFNLGIYDNESLKNFSFFLFSLYKAYVSSDILLLEINPLIRTFDKKIIPVDIKVILDDNALFRHKKYNTICCKDNDVNKIEKEAYKTKLNFLKLEGNVGCMVNGAGLAMATMDMIKFCGGVPANFLDIGGSADVERVEKAFYLILKDKYVKTILINIFGGIVRCDTVAKGIINSFSNLHKDLKKIPIVVRLQGTNDKIAKDLIKKSLLPIYSTDTLKEAADKIQKILYLK